MFFTRRVRGGILPFRGLASASVNKLSQTCAQPTEIYFFSPRMPQFPSWSRQRWFSSPWHFNLGFYWQAKIPVKISHGFSTSRLRSKQNQSKTPCLEVTWHLGKKLWFQGLRSRKFRSPAAQVIQTSLDTYGWPHSFSQEKFTQQTRAAVAWPQCIFPENYACGLGGNVTRYRLNGGGLSTCLRKPLINKYQKESLETLIPEKPSESHSCDLRKALSILLRIKMQQMFIAKWTAGYHRQVHRMDSFGPSAALPQIVTLQNNTKFLNSSSHPSQVLRTRWLTRWSLQSFQRQICTERRGNVFHSRM